MPRRHSVGWRREPARHSLAARGIKTGRSHPWWSGKIGPRIQGGVDWPILSHDEMQELMRHIEPVLEQNGIYATSGDCEEFAIALGNVIGEAEYVASYSNESNYLDGMAAHAALLHNGYIWDAHGQITEAKVLEYASNSPDHIPGQEQVVHTQDESEIMGGSYDPITTRKIERILLRVMKEGRTS